MDVVVFSVAVLFIMLTADRLYGSQLEELDCKSQLLGLF